MQFFCYYFFRKGYDLQLYEFKELLKASGITKKEFADLSNMSYGTVNSWGVEGRAEVPEWVKPFLENFEKAKKIDQIKKLIEADS